MGGTGAPGGAWGVVGAAGPSMVVFSAEAEDWISLPFGTWRSGPRGSRPVLTSLLRCHRGPVPQGRQDTTPLPSRFADRLIWLRQVSTPAFGESALPAAAAASAGPSAGPRGSVSVVGSWRPGPVPVSQAPVAQPRGRRAEAASEPGFRSQWACRRSSPGCGARASVEVSDPRSCCRRWRSHTSGDARAGFGAGQQCDAVRGLPSGARACVA